LAVYQEQYGIGELQNIEFIAVEYYKSKKGILGKKNAE
jgi:hypothetical protein